MLKVMKYDWKNGWNSVRILLLAGAVLSVLAGHVIASFENKATLAVIVWFAVMAALLVLTVDAIFRNMSGSMFGPKAYLTHTLPVETWELLLGKAAGTWLFGVFMVFAAVACWLLVLVGGVVGTSELWDALVKIVQALPKLGDYHFQQLAAGMGYLVYGTFAFLIGSFLLVLQFQFICIAARQFGRFHIAGGLIVFWVLWSVESIWNHSVAVGFLGMLLISGLCFAGSHWLLKHRLSV